MIEDKLSPVTPEPTYICNNCGVLVKTGHGHTRTECKQYMGDGWTVDNRALTTLLYARGSPKIKPPYYYEEGTFENWGNKPKTKSITERDKPDPMPPKSFLSRFISWWRG